MAWMSIGEMLFFLCVGCTAAQLISITPGWEAYLRTAQRFTNGDFYSITHGSANSIIASSNFTFALGLFSSDFSATVTMIICLLPFNTSIDPSTTDVIDVWNVGIRMSKPDHIVLRISSDKSELQLIDANKNVVWSIGKGVSALELEESGNLVVYNSSQIIWQSFEHPTDTFLPGQTLKQGMQLTASNSSYSANYSSVVDVEPSGVVYYSTVTDPPLPYRVYTNEGTSNSNYTKALQKCGDGGISVTYVRSNTSDSVQFNGSSCNKFDTFRISIHKLEYISNFRLLRFDSDGNLRHYIWKNDTGLIINSELLAQQAVCQLPNTCGSYGICSNEGQCNCPSTSSLGAVFHNTSNSGAKKGCKPATPLACDASSIRKQVFLNVSDVTYFSNAYVAPLNWTEKDQCVSSCLSNCSCLAAFYESSVYLSARACYHVSSHILSLQTISPYSAKNYTAYIKVQPSANKKKRSISHTVLIVSIVAGSAFLVLLASSIVGLIACFYLKKEDDFLKTVPGVPHKFSLKELEDATDGFKCKLGEGGFGAVFGGMLKDGRSIAAKRLEGARQGQQEFEAEVRTLGGIDHINLVPLYGFCIEGVNRLLVYERMPNGSLDKWLFKNDESDTVLSWSNRMAIAMDTAQGLAYLHEGCSRPVLHLDIKPQNILLAENFKAKLSDLGMAKLITQESGSVTTQIKGTPGYLAPEFLTRFLVSKKCDVYSYGIVLLEIITGKRVHGDCDTWFLPCWVFEKVRSGNFMEVVDPKLDENFDHDRAKHIIQLACCCIHESPEERPAMPDVIQMLQGKMEVPEPTFTQPQPITVGGTVIYGVHNSRNISYGVRVTCETQDSYNMLAPR